MLRVLLAQAQCAQRQAQQPQAQATVGPHGCQVRYFTNGEQLCRTQDVLVQCAARPAQMHRMNCGYRRSVPTTGARTPLENALQRVVNKPTTLSQKFGLHCFCQPNRVRLCPNSHFFFEGRVKQSPQSKNATENNESGRPVRNEHASKSARSGGGPPCCPSGVMAGGHQGAGKRPATRHCEHPLNADAKPRTKIGEATEVHPVPGLLQPVHSGCQP